MHTLISYHDGALRAVLEVHSGLTEDNSMELLLLRLIFRLSVFTPLVSLDIQIDPQTFGIRTLIFAGILLLNFEI